MTKDEIEVAWAHLPGNAQVVILGWPRRPDGDRYFEAVDVVKVLDDRTDSVDLDGDILRRFLNDETIIALETD